MNTSPFDEMRDAKGNVRAHYQLLADWLAATPPARIAEKRREADLVFHRVGITFAVYGDKDGAERLIPFDTIPRIIPLAEWDMLTAGLRQRASALNHFLHDVYHAQEIVKAGVIPAAQVNGNEAFQSAMCGIDLPNNIYSQISGIDLVRHSDERWYVLEDNLRTPSGVSYMIENRKMMLRLFPELFARQHVLPVEHYPAMLLQTLRASAPGSAREPSVVVLTPGPHNSAYFEHAFLAQQMGVELVEGRDLFVKDEVVYMRTTTGRQRVDVIYRRVDDAYLDPQAFRGDSMLGVPGLFSAYRAGKVSLSNAVGTGVADDKSTYPYVPEMIRFYLSEEPLLENVPTWQCGQPQDLQYVLDNLHELVVKEVQGSGGYGMLVGPAASRAQLADFRKRLRDTPENYIAQPTLSLSTCPTWVKRGIAPRHVDLRPFVLSGRETMIVPGGLTRVALKEGSLVVNSSQGGGTKDTWVVD